MSWTAVEGRARRGTRRHRRGRPSPGTDRLRAEHLTLPLIPITGMAGEDSGEKAFAPGATDFVMKPIDPNNVLGLSCASQNANREA